MLAQFEIDSLPKLIGSAAEIIARLSHRGKPVADLHGTYSLRQHERAATSHHGDSDQLDRTDNIDAVDWTGV